MFITRENVSRKRRSLILKVFMLVIWVVGVMSIVRVINGDYVQATVDLLFLGVLSGGYIRLKKNIGSYTTVARLVYASALLIALFVLAYHAESPIRFVWFTTVVYMTFYLFERKEAQRWLLSIGTVLTLFFLFQVGGFAVSLVDYLLWIANMLIVIVIAYWYAEIEKASVERMQDMQGRLKEEVRKKTADLEMLNHELEERIDEKVAKIKSQEEMMFRQARYAQMGEMIAMIAHQWRQPLHIIATLSATAKLQIEKDQKTKEQLCRKMDDIGTHVQHLSETIDDFRNFFKMDKHRSSTSLPDISEDALSLVQVAFQKHHITVHTDYQCNCSIYSYPNEILHVMLSILRNAQDALMLRKVTDPLITVRTYNEDDWHSVLEIEDNAGGIDAEDVSKVFDPYFTTKKDSDGTGLGLYFSALIIRDHCGGSIDVENSTEGALFRLTFPVA